MSARKLLIFQVGCLLLLSMTAANAASSKIGIIVFDDFLTSDVTAPLEVFGAASKKAWFSSYEVVLISVTQSKQVKSEEGLTVVAEHSIYDDLKLDVLLVPSAYDMDDVLSNKDLLKFIQKHEKTGGWLASNCSGAFLLGEAGVLSGKSATTWSGGEKSLQKDYPDINVLFDTNVVVDGKTVTSNGGLVSYQAAFKLLALMSSQKFSDQIAKSLQFPRLGSYFSQNH